MKKIKIIQRPMTPYERDVAMTKSMKGRKYDGTPILPRKREGKNKK